MHAYIIRRSILNIFVIFLVATWVFLLLRIDSSNVVNDFAGSCFGGGSTGDAAQQAQDCKDIARAQLGLHESLPVQYWNYMTDLVQGELGRSFKSQNPVMGEIIERLPPSIELGLLQLLVALMVALPIGIISAIRQDSWIDYLLRSFAIFFLGIPAFVVAILVILFTSRYAEGTFLADWFGPHSDYVTFREDPIQNLKIMFAPAVIGGLATGAIIMRFLRSQMLEVLRQDYVRTAWAKGLRERVVIVRHALKNALIPVLTVIGILLGTLVSGNVVLEVIYGIPGIGSYVVFAVAQRPDFPVIQGIVIVVAFVLVFVNLLVDVLYAWLDPRIRYS